MMEPEDPDLTAVGVMHSTCKTLKNAFTPRTKAPFSDSWMEGF